MKIEFRGGPYDGQVHELEPRPPGSVIYWPPRAELEIGDPSVPGLEGVVEYVVRDDETAEYVGGLPTQDEGSPTSI